MFILLLNVGVELGSSISVIIFLPVCVVKTTNVGLLGEPRFLSVLIRTPSAMSVFSDNSISLLIEISRLAANAIPTVVSRVPMICVVFMARFYVWG